MDSRTLWIPKPYGWIPKPYGWISKPYGLKKPYGLPKPYDANLSAPRKN
jgi:hypothetical protein